ncbi:MAG: DNA topoisomerase IV, partial [Ectopseudomonas oleovorans]
LWLAAEQRRRGLTVLHRRGSSWRCTGGCVLTSESGDEASPEALGGHMAPRDFSGLAYFGFASEALSEPRRYAPDYGMAEALWIDKDGAWIGVDNGSQTRADGEERPIVWRFAAPKGGWSRRP